MAGAVSRQLIAAVPRMSVWRRFLPPLFLIVASVGCVTILFRDRETAATAALQRSVPMHSSSPREDSAQRQGSRAGQYYRVEDLPAEPARPLRRLNPEELTPKLIRTADEVLFSQYPPVGTELPIAVDGKTYVGRVEVHFHEVGGPRRPWGRHRGITLYSTE